MKNISDYCAELNAANAKSLCAGKPWIREIAGDNGDLAAFLGDMIKDSCINHKDAEGARMEEARRWKQHGLIEAVFNTSSRPMEQLDAAEFIYEQHPEFWSGHLDLLNRLSAAAVQMCNINMSGFTPIIDILDEEYLEKCAACVKHTVSAKDHSRFEVGRAYYQNAYWAFIFSQCLTISRQYRRIAEKYLTDIDFANNIILCHFTIYSHEFRNILPVLDGLIVRNGIGIGIQRFNLGYGGWSSRVVVPLMGVADSISEIEIVGHDRDESEGKIGYFAYNRYTRNRSERSCELESLGDTFVESYTGGDAFPISALGEKFCRDVLDDRGIHSEDDARAKRVDTGNRYINNGYNFSHHVLSLKEKMERKGK
jgi:hypothetical protein